MTGSLRFSKHFQNFHKSSENGERILYRVILVVPGAVSFFAAFVSWSSSSMGFLSSFSLPSANVTPPPAPCRLPAPPALAAAAALNPMCRTCRKISSPKRHENKKSRSSSQIAAKWLSGTGSRFKAKRKKP